MRKDHLMLIKLLMILTTSSLAFADGDSGVGAAAKLQRAVLKGCILNEKYQPEFD